MNNDVLEKARKHGDINPNKPNQYWNSQAANGKGDWRIIPKSGNIPSVDGSSSQPVTKNDWSSSQQAKAPISNDEKLRNNLKNTSDDNLIKYASKPGNNPNLRQLAYDELVERGVDVSDIDMENGKLGKLKQTFGSAQKLAPKQVVEETMDYSQMPKKHSASEKTWKGAIDYFGGDTIDYASSDLINKVFGGLKTKANRIEYDKFVQDLKENDPFYLTPEEEIWDLNEQYAQALMSKAPLFIASGGAGVGKSFNFHAVAEILDMRQFDPETDQAGEGDYDYVEAPNPSSDKQFFDLLKEHNGKTIVFDDADGMYTNKATLDLLKKATNPSGKRIVGRAGESINFTGQIISITNKTGAQLTETDDLKAIYSRADKKDIYFTKKEQLGFMKKLLHGMNFKALPRLDDPQDDIKEREDVFKLLEDNVDQIDPQKFNARYLKDAIAMKRSSEVGAELIRKKGAAAAQFFGGGGNWQNKILRDLTKGEEDELNKTQMTFEKALEIFEL